MAAVPSSELDAFYADVDRADLRPLWTQTGLLPASPPIADVPYVWRWSRVRELAERAGRLVTVDRGGDRRVLALANPGLGGEPYATRTLWAAVQYLGPGEFAPAHRHTPAAIRFVLEGQGVWTLVDRDPVPMAPGDLVLTPSWCWHEHHSSGDGPMLWFDGLDLPMARALDAVFFEPGPSSTVDRLVDPVSGSEVAHGRAGLADDERPWRGTHSPLLAYRWNDTDAYLRDAVGRSDSGTRGRALHRPVDRARCGAHDALHRSPRAAGCAVPVAAASRFVRVGHLRGRGVRSRGGHPLRAGPR